MPLKDTDRPTYLQRTRLFVSSDDRRAEDSLYSFVYDLKDEIQDVVSVELTGWNINRRIAPTFIGRYLQTTVPYASTTNPRSDTPGNSMVDVEVTDETGTDTIVFTVDMDLVTPASGAAPLSYAGRVIPVADLATALGTAFSRAFIDVTHPTLNATNYNLFPSVDELGRFFVYMQKKSDPTLKPTVRLLFGTGPNRADSMHRVLGVPAEDTLPDPTTNGFQSLCMIEPVPLRYIDVRLSQFDELNPVGRIFLAAANDADFVEPQDKPEAVRVLLKPIRRLAELKIDLVLPEGQAPNHEVTDGYELQFDVLSLATQSKVPGWLRQKLTF